MEPERKLLHLHESETVVVHAASRIFSAYITAGKVDGQNEAEMLEKSIEIALEMARKTDTLVMDDAEVKRRSGKLAY